MFAKAKRKHTSEKSRDRGELGHAQIDLWTRNLQLAFYSLVFGLPGLFLSSDGSRVTREGFFQGYTWLTWTCVLMNACGGLLVGMVIKYANAIVKDIALALSICCSSVAAIPLFGFRPTVPFFGGVALVCYAAALYGGIHLCFF